MGNKIMSYKTFSFLGLVILLLLGGCGLKEGVVNKEQKSFLLFTGNTKNVTAHIDDLAPFTLKKRNGEIHYQLSSGKHSIIIKRAGVEIVNRNILLGNGITREIQIP